MVDLYMPISEISSSSIMWEYLYRNYGHISTLQMRWKSSPTPTLLCYSTLFAHMSIQDHSNMHSTILCITTTRNFLRQQCPHYSSFPGSLRYLPCSLNCEFSEYILSMMLHWQVIYRILHSSCCWILICRLNYRSYCRQRGTTKRSNSYSDFRTIESPHYSKLISYSTGYYLHRVIGFFDSDRMLSNCRCH